MLKCGVLGERLSHSFSPQIHAELGGYEFLLYEKKPEELENFVRNGDFDGLNVTIPYKKAVIPFCTGLSETARAIGSVNTLVRLKDGGLYGDNTDYFGFEYLLGQAGVDIAGGKAIILGSGGASLTVQAVLRDKGAREVIVVSRTGENNYENVHRHSDAIIIVNATPVGMYPNNGASPFTGLANFHNCRAVIDLIYNPAKTELLLDAEDCGIPGFGGLAMLVAQAKRASEIFVGAKIPDARIERITASLSQSTQNIILIGMPGCGKSSIGAALSIKLGREFTDTDELVETTAGKPIPAIFAQDGESAFRALETAVLAELCKQSGMVIATGGGIVTRPENRHIIRQNGTVVFLDRDISELPLSGRPLSEKDGVAKLAETRMPLYLAWSDHAIPVHSVEHAAAAIHEKLFGGAQL